MLVKYRQVIKANRIVGVQEFRRFDRNADIYRRHA